jgi:tetratricopeptide (TPR) repeat protein
MPGLPGLGQRRINTLFQLKRFEDCLQLYKELLDRNPADPDIHRAYNSLLYRLGRTDEYLASYDKAPQTREILLGKASMLGTQKRGAEMAEDLQHSAVARSAGRRGGRRLGQQPGVDGPLWGGGFGFRGVINRRSDDPTLFCSAAGAALLAADPQKAEYFCRAGLRLQPYDQACLAFLGIAWRLQDDAQDQTLNGYDKLIQVFDLEPPDGFSDMDSFNAELGAYLERLHPQTDAYLEQSLRGGTQTEGTIFGVGHALVEKLRVRIEQAISAILPTFPTMISIPSWLGGREISAMPAPGRPCCGTRAFTSTTCIPRAGSALVTM